MCLYVVVNAVCGDGGGGRQGSGPESCNKLTSELLNDKTHNTS